MKKIIFTISGIYFTFLTLGQTPEYLKLNELKVYYLEYMSQKQPSEKALVEIKQNVPESLKKTTEFIVQRISLNNNLLNEESLILPDELTLKYIYIVNALVYNSGNGNNLDNNKLIDSLIKKTVTRYECVDNYYGILFIAVANKNKPFDFSNINFIPRNYNLSDKTEIGIFFLRCMFYCGRIISGYVNIIKPPDFNLAFDNIKKFPRFNGTRYYQFCDLNFPDFKIRIKNYQKPQSYKGYYIDKYYEVLLTHLKCLNRKSDSDNEKRDLFFTSILRDQRLFEYSVQKKKLEEIYNELEK